LAQATPVIHQQIGPGLNVPRQQGKALLGLPESPSRGTMEPTLGSSLRPSCPRPSTATVMTCSFMPSSARQSTASQVLPGARYGKLLQGCDKLVSGVARAFMEMNHRSTFGQLLPLQTSDSVFRRLQAEALGEMVGEMELQQREALIRHGAVRQCRALDGTLASSPCARMSRPAVSPAEVAEMGASPPVSPTQKSRQGAVKQMKRKLDLHMEASKVGMLRKQLEEQLRQNDELEAEIASLRATGEDILRSLDESTCRMIAPLLKQMVMG